MTGADSEEGEATRHTFEEVGGDDEKVAVDDGSEAGGLEGEETWWELLFAGDELFVVLLFVFQIRQFLFVFQIQLFLFVFKILQFLFVFQIL